MQGNSALQRNVQGNIERLLEALEGPLRQGLRFTAATSPLHALLSPIVLSHRLFRFDSAPLSGLLSGMLTRSNPIRDRTSPEILEADRRSAFAFTAELESGRGSPSSPSQSAAALQTLDSGIVSYGTHQATLRSGALGEVLNRYLTTSGSQTAQLLLPYRLRVDARDLSLRGDTQFHELLRRAADEPAMVTAQEGAFAELYWNPAVREAARLGYSSREVRIALFDTAVQGGLRTVLGRVQARFPAVHPEESVFLRAFCDERRKYLLEIADRKELSGELVEAQMLRTSAFTRINALESLLSGFSNP